jgi:hypothetical protein
LFGQCCTATASNLVVPARLPPSADVEFLDEVAGDGSPIVRDLNNDGRTDILVDVSRHCGGAVRHELCVYGSCGVRRRCRHGVRVGRRRRGGEHDTGGLGGESGGIDPSCADMDGVAPVYCDFDGAWDLAVSDRGVFWIAGSDAAGTCPEGAPCGTPRLHRLEHGSFTPATVELSGRPRVVAAGGDVVLVTTGDALLQVSPDGDVTIVDDRPLDVQIDGDDACWMEEGELWCAPLADLGARQLVFAGAGRTVGFDADAGTFAWIEIPSDAPDNELVDGTLWVLAAGDTTPTVAVEPVTSGELKLAYPYAATATALTGLVIHDLEAGTSEVVVADAFVISPVVDDTGVMFVVADITGSGAAEVAAVAWGSGAWTTLAQYDGAPAEPGPANLALYDGELYWTDTRIVRLPAPAD